MCVCVCVLVSRVLGISLFYDWVPCHCWYSGIPPPWAVSYTLLDSRWLRYVQWITCRAHRRWHRGRDHTWICVTTNDTTQTSTAIIPYTHKTEKDRPYKEFNELEAYFCFSCVMSDNFYKGEAQYSGRKPSNTRKKVTRHSRLTEWAIFKTVILRTRKFLKQSRFSWEPNHGWYQNIGSIPSAMGEHYPWCIQEAFLLLF